MPALTSNIEPLARAICERGLQRTVSDPAELAACVDRFWHCVAAEMEAGLIDEDGNAITHDFDQGLAAYRDWRQRHADYKPPPPWRAPFVDEGS